MNVVPPSCLPHGETLLRKRLERAGKDDDLARTAKCVALSAFVCAVVRGIAEQAKAGFRRSTLDAAAEQALSTWPGSKRG